MAYSVQYDYSLLSLNTFGISASASRFVAYDSAGTLRQILQHPADCPDLLPVGQGSNLLFTQDYPGTVLHSQIKTLTVLPAEGTSVRVRVGSGVLWDDFCDRMAALNLYGAENLSYIPGQVGAAAVQNIGAYGAEVSNLIEEVETLDAATGEPRTFSHEECRYAYRDSIFKNELWRKFIVTAVLFRLSAEPRLNLSYGQLRELQNAPAAPTAQAVRQAVIAIRRSKLPEPGELGSAGSFFKNPVVPLALFQRLQQTYPAIPHYTVSAASEKIPAAWLIEQCGWKGKSLGGAQVYEKQPLIIVNRSHASASDIVALAAAVSQSVLQKFGIAIRPEVNYI